MKIQYKKIVTNEIPEKTNEITPSLHTVDNSPEELVLYVSSKSDDNVAYQFSIVPDTEFGTYTDLMNDLTTALFTKTVEGINDEDEKDVRRSVNIVTGEVAAKNDNSPVVTKMKNGQDEQEEIDPRGKIFYHLINGRIMYTDINAINWEENIKHIDDIQRMADNVRGLINLLLTEKTFKKPAQKDKDGNEVAPEKEITVEELVEEELRMFHATNKLDIDYSMYDNYIATKREVLIAKLIDVLTIYNELILVSSVIAGQNQVIEQFTKQAQPATEEEKEAIDEVVETETLETVDAEELPAEE